MRLRKTNRRQPQKKNEVISTRLESITGEKRQTERAQVPQQDEGESCGCGIASYLNKGAKGQTIHQKRAKKIEIDSITGTVVSTDIQRTLFF